MTEKKVSGFPGVDAAWENWVAVKSRTPTVIFKNFFIAIIWGQEMNRGAATRDWLVFQRSWLRVVRLNALSPHVNRIIDNLPNIIAAFLRNNAIGGHSSLRYVRAKSTG